MLGFPIDPTLRLLSLTKKGSGSVSVFRLASTHTASALLGQGGQQNPGGAELILLLLDFVGGSTSSHPKGKRLAA